jgi:2-methylaconitate cis-trans-isomerase PrpF
MCLAAAVALPGTIANDLAGGNANAERAVRIAHAAGTIEIGVHVAHERGEWRVCSTTTWRTARKIMDGHVYVPSSYLAANAWFER